MVRRRLFTHASVKNLTNGHHARRDDGEEDTLYRHDVTTRNEANGHHNGNDGRLTTVHARRPRHVMRRRVTRRMHRIVNVLDVRAITLPIDRRHEMGLRILRRAHLIIMTRNIRRQALTHRTMVVRLIQSGHNLIQAAMRNGVRSLILTVLGNFIRRSPITRRGLALTNNTPYGQTEYFLGR